LTKRYELKFEEHREVIVDTETRTNVFFLASTGHGTPSSLIELAEKVVDFMNRTNGWRLNPAYVALDNEVPVGYMMGPQGVIGEIYDTSKKS
jgi:hypothetical protein